jgi:hypothetical protein
MRTTEWAANFSRRFTLLNRGAFLVLLWPVRWVWLALRTFYQTDDESPVTFMYPHPTRLYSRKAHKNSRYTHVRHARACVAD